MCCLQLYIFNYTKDMNLEKSHLKLKIRMTGNMLKLTRRKKSLLNMQIKQIH